MTPYAALLERVTRAPATPLVTYVDPTSGERMELSAASYANAVSKTAGLLRDELDAEPGDRIAIHLPWHWQRAVWFGACASTGTVFVADGDPATSAVCVVDRDHLHLTGAAPWDVLVSLAPFGLPDGEPVPTGIVEAAVAMRAHPDTFVPYTAPDPSTPLLVRREQQISAEGAWDQAGRLAMDRDLHRGCRYAVLADDPDGELLLVTCALAIDGSVVLLGREAEGMERLLDAEGARLTRPRGDSMIDSEETR